jgi:hypothetical protein
MNEIELIIVNKGTTSEYFCNDCGQLRLSFKPKADICGNCGGNNLITGEVNSLNKEQLKEEWRLRNELEND